MQDIRLHVRNGKSGEGSKRFHILSAWSELDCLPACYTRPVHVESDLRPSDARKVPEIRRSIQLSSSCFEYCVQFMGPRSRVLTISLIISDIILHIVVSALRMLDDGREADRYPGERPVASRPSNGCSNLGRPSMG